MDVAQAIGVIGAIFGIVATAGAIFGAFRIADFRTRLDLLRGDVSDWQVRDRRKTEEITELRAKVDALGSENQILHSLVFGKERFDHLDALLGHLSAQWDEHGRKVDEYHSILRSLIRSVHKDETRMLWDLLQMVGDGRGLGPRRRLVPGTDEDQGDE